MAEIARIKIWDKKVGAVAYDRSSGISSFEFEAAFLNTGWDLSPIKMPLKSPKGTVFKFPDLSRNSSFKGLPGLLADALPDNYGHALIDAWLSRNGRASGSLNPVEILCFIGKRAMGALEFEPVEPKATNTATKIEIDSLVEIAQDILLNRKDFAANLSGEEEKAMLDILKIGTSAGGARAKAIIAYNPITGEVRSGQTNAPQGFSHWLIKFDGVEDKQFGVSSGYGRVEMAYYNMARECKIEMTECQLYEENGRAHFMTRRFDRPSENEKLHVQTFHAMQHYDFQTPGYYSYEQLFETMRLLRLDYYPRAEQLYRRMVFNAMARNCDDHTKNFAFTMDKESSWNLSPAYDVCHAYRPQSSWVDKHNLTINGKRENFTKDDFLTVAKNMNIKKAGYIIEEISTAVKKWPDFADEQKVDSGLRDSIQITLLPL